MFVVIRIFMLVGCTVAGAGLGAILSSSWGAPAAQGAVIGALTGVLVAVVGILTELALRRVMLGHLIVVGIGIVVGTLVMRSLFHIVALVPGPVREFLNAHHVATGIIAAALYVFFVYICIVIAARGRAELSLLMPRLKKSGGLPPLLLDTSAIIDGRVAELYKTGFLRHRILVPEFILHELQLISDSQVALTRAKGRRGLDTLKRLQDQPGVEIEVTSIDFPDVREVDDKLMKLAKEINGIILTTDYNLEQVAKIQNIQCLNVFALVNAVKTPFIPGERMTLQIIKEGSEPNQGVGFLDDGTMIVVSNARPYIGQKAEVELVSMIQGASGRIFFGQVVEGGASGGGASAERNVHAGARGPERRRA
ncbi:MAG: PIN/TRAM domain-containing protein [bacterium]|nr:PIN/TRAM domain-containing protein [bacterium]